MADIELVIKIDEKLVEWIDEYYSIIKGFNGEKIGTIVDAIKNGKLIPKGHGKLIDAGQCDRKLFYQQCGGADSLITVESAFDMLMSLPTIIEADKAESEG